MAVPTSSTFHSRRWYRYDLRALLICVAVAGCGANEKPRAPDPNTDASLHPLAQARVDVARKAYESAAMMLQAGSPGVKPEYFYTWSVHWLNAERDLSNKHEDQLAALNAHLQRMQQAAKMTNALVQSGMAAPFDSAAADFYLREAELWLAQETVAAKPVDK